MVTKPLADAIAVHGEFVEVIVLPSHFNLNDMVEPVKRGIGWDQKFAPYLWFVTFQFDY